MVKELIDLRDEKLEIISFYMENNKPVYQVSFGNYVLKLNEETVERLRNI